MSETDLGAALLWPLEALSNREDCAQHLAHWNLHPSIAWHDQH